MGRAEYAFQNFYQSAINAKTGHPCVGFGVIQLPGSNAITTAKAVDAVLRQFQSTLPPGVVLEKVFDQTDFINGSIQGALDALRDAVVLVLLIIFLFLQDWKATAVPAWPCRSPCWGPGVRQGVRLLDQRTHPAGHHPRHRSGGG